MSSQPIIDVKKVIEDSTQVKTIQELEKEGRRAVKVVRASRISELISQAVDNVIQHRSMEVVESERNQLIQATGDEFRRLLKDADNQRRETEESREKLQTYEKEILELKHKLELAEHVHEQDLKLLDEQRHVVDELKEKVNLLKHELEERVKRHQGEIEEHEGLREEALGSRAEARQLREQLARSEEARRDAETRAQEAVPAQAAASETEMMSKLEGVIHSSMDQLTKQLTEHFQSTGGAGLAPGVKPVEAAKIVLDNLFADTGKNESIESNLEKITVKSSEGTGIGANLARLKKMHQQGIGGSDGESGAAGGNDSEVSKGENDG